MRIIEIVSTLFARPKVKPDLLIETARSRAVKGSIYVAINRNTFIYTDKLTISQVKVSPLAVIDYLASREDDNIIRPLHSEAVIQINKQIFRVKDLNIPSLK